MVQGLCALFAPGNRHAVVGTKEGMLQVLDVGASTVLDTLDAHKGAVSPLTCLNLLPGVMGQSDVHIFWVHPASGTTRQAISLHMHMQKGL